MKKRILITFLAMVILSLPVLAQTGRVEVLNDHHLQYESNPVLLWGSSDWDLIGELAYTEEEYKDYIDWHSEYGGNFMRLTTMPLFHRIDEEGGLIYPWTRSSECCTYNGEDKFDLDSFNEEYWQRLDDIISYAESKDVIILLQFFDEVLIEYSNSHPDADRYSLYPFNPHNNVNYGGQDNCGSIGIPEINPPSPSEDASIQHCSGEGNERDDYDWNFYDIYNTELIEYQDDYVDKLVDTLHDNGNIIYEIANEYAGENLPQVPPPEHYDWVQHWVDKFQDYETQYGVNLLLTNMPMQEGYDQEDYFQDPGIALTDFYKQLSTNDLQEINDVISESFYFQNNPDYYKPILMGRVKAKPDQYPNQLRDGRQQFWTAFVSGGQGSTFKEAFDVAPSDCDVGVPYYQCNHDTENIIRGLRGFAYSTEFWKLEPGDDIIDSVPTGTTAYALKNEISGEEEYVIYLYGSTSASTLTIDIALGDFLVEVYNPETNSFSLDYSTQITGGSNIQINLPLFSEDLTVHIFKNNLRKGNLITQTPEQLSTNSNGHVPKIVIDSNGNPHVTFLTGPHDGQVKYTKYEDGGWITPITIESNIMNDKLGPEIAVGEDGTVHLVYGNMDEQKSYYRTYTESGGISERETIFNSDPVNHRDTSVQVNSEGEVFVIFRSYHETDDGHIYYMKRSGGTWEGPIKISSNSPSVSRKRPNSAIGQDDTLHVVWRQRAVSGENYRTFYRKCEHPCNSAGDWGSIEYSLDENRRTGEDPHVIVDNSNIVHFSWGGGIDGSEDIIYSNENEDPWYGQLLGNAYYAQGHLTDPVLSLDSYNNKYIFYNHRISYNDGTGWSEMPYIYDVSADQPWTANDNEIVHLVYRKNNNVYYSTFSIETQEEVIVDENSITVSQITETTATIEWDTNIESTSIVFYDYESHPLPDQYLYSQTGHSGIHHTVQLTNLNPDTTYHFRVVSEANGDVDYSNNQLFTTLQESEQGCINQELLTIIDENQDYVIQTIEMISSVNKWFKGNINAIDLISIIRAYSSGSAIPCLMGPGELPEIHWLELEYPKTMEDPMNVYSDREFGEASNGRYIATYGDSGSATLEVDIKKAGTYYFWIRSMWTDGGSNSFNLIVDDNSPIVVGNVNDNYNIWQWINYRDGDPNTVVSLELSAGKHTITLEGREGAEEEDRKARGDKILLTENENYQPSGMGNLAENIVLVFNLDTLSTQEYEIAENLDIGDICYVDRDYDIIYLPEELESIDLTWIKTANDDKVQPQTNDWITFNIGQDSTIYVAVDERNVEGDNPAGLPSWMQEGWTQTNGRIGIQAVNGQRYYIAYYKYFSEGEVSLGANEDKNNMYLLIIKEGTPALLASSFKEPLPQQEY